MEDLLQLLKNADVAEVHYSLQKNHTLQGSVSFMHIDSDGNIVLGISKQWRLSFRRWVQKDPVNLILYSEDYTFTNYRDKSFSLRYPKTEEVFTFYPYGHSNCLDS